MFIGHYGIAFALKKYDKKLNLGFLFIVAQLLDFAFNILVIVGIEHVRIVPGFTESNSLDLYYFPFSHSLLAAVLWAIGTYFVVRYLFLKKSEEPEMDKSKKALILGIAVFSHWILDLIVHVPDLQLSPGIEYRVGFGLWNYFFIALAVELSVLLIGCFIYLKSATSEDNFVSNYGMLLFIFFLILMTVLTSFSPAPPNIITLMIIGLITNFLFAIIAFLLDRKRIPIDVENL